MSKMILRSFLYLDEDVVDDYLSQLEGDIIEGAFSEETEMTSGKEGNFKLGVQGLGVGAGGNKGTTSKVSQTRRETPGAKFARLYDSLKENDLLRGTDLGQPRVSFSQATYDKIEVGELFELRGDARLTQWDRIMNDLDSFVSMAELMKQMGQDPYQDPATRQVLEILPDLKAATGRESTLLIVTPNGAPEFKFVLALTDSKLRRRKEELEAEVTVLGKVQRRLAKGESIEVFRLLPRLSALQKLNKGQPKSKRGTRQFPSTDSPYDEVIKYPAVELAPVAVYS